MSDETEEMRRKIERFIGAYEGTAIGQSIKNMYENAPDDEDALKDICESCGM